MTLPDDFKPLPESRLHEPASSSLLLQIRSDRRLGHEWDDWDGEALPNQGDFQESAAVFFMLALATGLGVAVSLSVVLWTVQPRLESVATGLAGMMVTAVLIAMGAWIFWLAGIYAVMRSGRNWLPRRLAEGGLIPWLLPKLERVGGWLGLSRDRVGNGVLQVFNRLATTRTRARVAPEELLILLPRCLGREAMQAAMTVSARYGVPVFVASRGRYARQMISMRRPRGVVAVACERDLVSGVHDVAGRLPVLGTTLQLGEGPCRNTSFRIGDLEQQVQAMLGIRTTRRGDPAFASLMKKPLRP
jgi:uncharacterized protein